MEDPPKTPPIEKQEYIHGVKVVDFGDIRVSRGLSRRPYSGCNHLNLVYDQRERRVWCEDCETDVEPFDAFMGLVERHSTANAKLIEMQEEAHEASKFSLISRAAKAIDRHWRSRKMVPACPHCNAGIWPEDALKMGSVGKDFDKARREKLATTRNPR